jgi:hypothetical protein
MNITKEFHDYVNIVKNTLTSKFVLKCEKYNPIDKCTRLLRQISEIERNLDTMTTSKTNLIFSVQKKFSFQ